MSTNPIIPYTFVPGTKAKAQEVNANFISVADHIQSNTDYINQKYNEITGNMELTETENGEKFDTIDTTLDNKADKDFANVTTLASSSTKGITWFGTATNNISATRPAVVVTAYSSGSTWYRLYSDKWIEQGGLAAANNSADSTVTITFPKAFKDTNYSFRYSSLCSDLVYNTYYFPKLDAGAYTAVATANIKIMVAAKFKRVLWSACGYIK